MRNMEKYQKEKQKKLEQLLEQASDRQEEYDGAPEDDFRIVKLIKGQYFMQPGEKIAVFIPKKGDCASLHKHDYIEMNYVWKGTFRQVIEGKEVISLEGDVCIFDTLVMHSIEDVTGQGILVNILMQKEYLDTAFLSRISRQGSVVEFLVEAVLKNRKKEHYLFFNSHLNEKVTLIMENILMEYFEKNIGYEEVWNSYMVILFTELLRTVGNEPGNQSDRDDVQILKILSYIEKEYATCSLREAAAECGLNPNYLTTLLKKRTGFSFLEHVQRKKVTKAKYYLENTDISIAEIAELCGYQNLNFFYKLFEKEFQCTPAGYRKQIRRNP